jgi:predicted Na+-dependent transporter
MTTAQQTPDRPSVARPGVFRAFVIVAHLVALLVFVQAVLAGRWLVDTDIIKSHGYLASYVILPLTLAQVVLAYLSGLSGRARSALPATSLVLLVLIIAQIGSGYAGRDRNNVAAIHLPNGVLIFGLTVANISLIGRARREGGGV